MGLKVAKFGGSSVADGFQLAKMKKIVSQDPERRYVVVSASGKRFPGDNKITDLLYLCLSQIQNNISYDQVFQVIADRFTAIKLKLDIDIDLESIFDEIHDNINNGASQDYVVSRGEYVTARIVSAYMGYDFVDAKDLIKFDRRGRVLMDETNALLGAELSKHEHAVIPGFYGSYEDTGDIRVFSRGGSDITGALVARAVNADTYENWTDVSGFLMADPRIVKDPEPIHNISYMELRELSYMGASVLHEDAIYPARLAGIPINIRNTNMPDDPGTVITEEHDPNDRRVITGIAGNKDFTVIAIYKNGLNKEKGFIRRLLTIVEDNGINLEHIPTGIDTVSIVISDDELDGKLEDVLEDIKAQLKPDDINVYSDIALIATVGCGMSRRAGVSARLFTALASDDINIRMIDQGSSEMNIIIGVENSDFEKAIRDIYNAFEAE
jgi:aspartate kinase